MQEANKITGANHEQAGTVSVNVDVCPRLPVVAQFRRWASKPAMNVQRKIILLSLLVWVLVTVGAAFHFKSILAALVLPLAPMAILFPYVTGFLAYVVEPAEVLVLCTLAVLAWRKCSRVLTSVFCCLLGAILTFATEGGAPA